MSLPNKETAWLFETIQEKAEIKHELGHIKGSANSVCEQQQFSG
jgi:hypothetical protein